MGNPGFFDNLGRNLGAISQTPRKLFEMANKSDNPIGNAVQGVGQNLGSIGKLGEQIDKQYLGGNTAKVLFGKNAPKYFPENNPNQTREEKIRQNIRAEGDIRRFRDIVDYAPQIAGKNLEQAVVYAPEFIAGAGGAILGGIGGGVLGGGVGALPGAVGGAVGAQLGLGAIADKTPWLKKGLDSWHEGAQNFANWTTGKQPSEKGKSVRTEEVDKLKLKSYKEQADRIKKLLKEGKITEQEAASYLEDFHIGAGTLDFAGDMLLDPTNLVDFGGGKAGKVARKFDPNAGMAEIIRGKSNIADEIISPEIFNASILQDNNVLNLGTGSNKTPQIQQLPKINSNNYQLNNSKNLPVGTPSDLNIQESAIGRQISSIPQINTPTSITDQIPEINFGQSKLSPEKLSNINADRYDVPQYNIGQSNTYLSKQELPKIDKLSQPIPQVAELNYGQLANEPQSPTQISSIGDYIRDEVVPAKKSDLQALLDSGSITPSAAKKRQDTIYKYEAEAVSPKKVNDFRPMGTSFAPETQAFIDDFSAKLKELNRFAPEQSIKVTGKEDVPFQNELQKTMINYGNFDKLKRGLKPQEQAYKDSVDKILATEYGMTPDDLKAFLDESGYARANNRKSIDQNYSTKYNDNIGPEGYFASRMSPNKGVPGIEDGQGLVDDSVFGSTPEYTMPGTERNFSPALTSEVNNDLYDTIDLIKKDPTTNPTVSNILDLYSKLDMEVNKGADINKINNLADELTNLFNSSNNTSMSFEDIVPEVEGFLQSYKKPDISESNASNRYNENLNAFMKDSKMKTEDGKPEELYHGSPRSFNTFKADPNKGYYVYMTNNKKIAKSYMEEDRVGTTPTLNKLYADIRNPLVIEGNGSHWASIPFEGNELPTDEIVSIAYKRGYDGVRFKNIKDTKNFDPEAQDSDVVVAFNPNQVKNVNNLGSFNPNDPNMYHSPASNRSAAMMEATKPGKYMPNRTADPVKEDYPELEKVVNELYKGKNKNATTTEKFQELMDELSRSGQEMTLFEDRGMDFPSAASRLGNTTTFYSSGQQGKPGFNNPGTHIHEENHSINIPSVKPEAKVQLADIILDTMVETSPDLFKSRDDAFKFINQNTYPSDKMYGKSAKEKLISELHSEIKAYPGTWGTFNKLKPLVEKDENFSKGVNEALGFVEKGYSQRAKEIDPNTRKIYESPKFLERIEQLGDLYHKVYNPGTPVQKLDNSVLDLNKLIRYGKSPENNNDIFPGDNMPAFDKETNDYVQNMQNKMSKLN